MIANQARKEVRKEVVTRAFIVFVLVLGLFLLSATALQLALLDQRGKDNRHTLVALNAQAALIKSCTTPGEPCYERGQRQTGDAVANINRVVILAAACARGKTGTEPVIEAQIQACVVEGLARQKDRP